MNLFSNPNRRAGLAGKLALAFAFVCLAPVAALAGGGDQGAGGAGYVSNSRVVRMDVGPNNTTPGTYRALVADGSNLYQPWAGNSTKWYAFLIEPGKTYVVEALDPYTDFPDGSVFGLGVFDSNGTTTPPPETQINCSIDDHAPGLSNYALRCIVRAFAFPGATLTKRLVYVRVDAWINTAFQIRVREATIYGRWTANGYNFHVELQNTTSDSICAELAFYGDSGMGYSAGAFTGTVPFATLTIPPFGAAKYVLPSGTTAGVSNTDLRGSLRIMACPGPVNLNTAGLNVSTYGFNPTVSGYLYFFTNQPNAGNGSSF